MCLQYNNNYVTVQPKPAYVVHISYIASTSLIDIIILKFHV